LNSEILIGDRNEEVQDFLMTKAGEGRNENNRMFLNMLRFTRGDNVK
jgi:hypothetical protein